MKCAVSGVKCAVCHVQCVVFSGQCAVCSVQCVVCSFFIYSVQCSGLDATHLRAGYGDMAGEGKEGQPIYFTSARFTFTTSILK